jgi:hypothetical protein
MANLSREAIDNSRKLQNLPPISDDEFASLQGNGHSDKEKEALLQKQKEEEDAKKAEEEKNKLKTAEVEKVRELTDEEIMAIVAKKTGRTVASWDELKPTQEIVDKEEAKAERESEKLTWGLKNKKFKQKDYENFIADSKEPQKLVYNLRLAEARKEDPNLDEKEFELEFNEEFGLDSKTDTRRYKNGQDTLKRLSSAIMQGTYAPILTLENEYSQYEKQQNSQREQQNKIKAEAPAYKQTLDKVISGLKKIKTQFKEGDEYEVDAVEDSLNNIKELMLSPEFASQQILKGYTEKDLNDIAYTKFIVDNHATISQEIAKQYLKKHAAGTKGILTINPAGKVEEMDLTPAQEKMKSIIEANKPAVPAQAN